MFFSACVVYFPRLLCPLPSFACLFVSLCHSSRSQTHTHGPLFSLNPTFVTQTVPSPLSRNPSPCQNGRWTLTISSLILYTPLVSVTSPSPSHSHPYIRPPSLTHSHTLILFLYCYFSAVPPVTESIPLSERLMDPNLPGPSHFCRPSWPSFMCDSVVKDTGMIYRSFSEYQDDLDLRVNPYSSLSTAFPSSSSSSSTSSSSSFSSFPSSSFSTSFSSCIPRKFRCSGRVGRGGRIVLDRFPVRNAYIRFILGLNCHFCLFFCACSFCLLRFF